MNIIYKIGKNNPLEQLMHRNYFTLYHTAMELHARLVGGFVFEIHSQHKNELTLSFITAAGEHLQVIMVLRVPELCLFTREGMNRRKRQSANLLHAACEREVQGVSMSPCDREILISLSGDYTLVLRLFSASANAFLVTEEGTVADACIAGKNLIGTAYRDKADRSSPDIIRELELLAQQKKRFFALVGIAEGSKPQLSPGSLPGFDQAMLRTLSEQAGESGDPEDLFDAFSDIFYELLDPMPQTGRTPQGKPLFSILHRPLPESRRYASVLEGLNRYSSAMWSWLHAMEERGEFETKLRQQLRKIEKELQEHDPGMLAGKAEEYQTRGHLLIGALSFERTLPDSITVPDIFNPDQPDISISLKPELSLSDNAAEYFSKAAKTREKIKTMERRKTELEERKALLESLSGEITALLSPKEVKQFLETRRSELRKTGIEPAKTASEMTSRFRTVKLTASATLYIGKNATNNDLLTFSFARPNDIWLHARGCSGSHCVLRGVTLQQKEEIRRAAEYAARYSAAKHSELVPVMYALKKHVRRSKRLAPGQVLLEREEVIMVPPATEAD